MPRREPSQHDALRVLLLGQADGDQAPMPAPTGGGRNLTVVDLRGHEEDLATILEVACRSEAAVVTTDESGEVAASVRRAIAVAFVGGIRDLVFAVPAGEPLSSGLPSDVSALAEALGASAPVVVPLGTDRARPNPALLSHLQTVALDPSRTGTAFRMVVDTDAGPGATSVSGRVASGRARPGDEIVAASSGRGARIVSIAAGEEERGEIVAGDAATLQLDRAIDARPGEVMAAAGDRPETCDQFASRLLWFDAEPLLPGRAYRMRIGTREVPASVTRIKHRIDGGGPAALAAGTLRSGDLGQVNLSLAEPVVFEPFERSRVLGTFALTDRSSGRTVAVGRIDFALRRAANIHRQAVDVTKAARAEAKAQRPALLWFTGLSGAGKSTIANLVEKRLFALGHHTYLLDGDNVRHGLNRDLGFTAQDRVENIRRVAETAKLMVDAGLITLASFISPFRAERRLARDLLAEGEFIEVFVDAPLGVAEARDPKGLYAQARAGRIPNFTGIDSPYEPPEAPELHLETDRRSAEHLADDVVAHLERAGFLRPPI